MGFTDGKGRLDSQRQTLIWTEPTIRGHTKQHDSEDESVARGHVVATPKLEKLSVDWSNGTGFKEMVKPVLAGNFIPLGNTKGRQFQMFMRNTGDWWMNVDGNDTWLEIYEV